MSITKRWRSSLARLCRPLLLSRLRPLLDPNWRVLTTGWNGRLEINVACGQLLVCGSDYAEIRPISDLREATACEHRDRHGRRRADIRLRLGENAGDVAIIGCSGMVEARHIAALLGIAMLGRLRADAAGPHVWSAEAAIYSRLSGTH
ncbi:MAG: hypothetical protein JHC88_15960 [Niveispirillum sp.]|nr:hypothetical protein [Niveispirillum sp.]